jgi:hypothetical protein
MRDRKAAFAYAVAFCFALAPLACSDEASPAAEKAGSGGASPAASAGRAGEGGEAGAPSANAYLSGPTGTPGAVASADVVVRGVSCRDVCAPQFLGLARTVTGELAFAGAFTGQATVLDDSTAPSATEGLGFLALLAPGGLGSTQARAFPGQALGATGFVAASGAGIALLASLRTPLTFAGQTFDPAAYPDGAQIVLAFDDALSLRFGRVFPAQAVTAFAGSAAGAVALGFYAAGDLDLGCGPLDSPLGTSAFVLLQPDGSCLRQRVLGEAAAFDGAPANGPTEINQLSFGIGTTVAVAGRFVNRLVIDDRTLEHAGSASFLADFFETAEVRWTRKVAFLDSPSNLTMARDGFGAFAVTTTARGPLDLGHGPRGNADDPGSHGHLARFDYEGLPLWHRVLPPLDGNELHPTINAGGEVFLAGSFQGTIDFGDGPLVSAGRTDAFVTAISHEKVGASKWSVRWGGPDDERVQGLVADGDAVFALGSPAAPPAAAATPTRLIAGVSRLPLP